MAAFTGAQFGEFCDIYLRFLDEIPRVDEFELNNDEVESLDTSEQFMRKLKGFNSNIQELNELELLLLGFTPGLSINSSFAKGEEQSNQSLSGGEKSVVSLCLAACCKKSNLIVIDEINQGMDDIFETAAHNLILGLQGQVLVSSPKLGSGMGFDDAAGHVCVHILVRQTL